jgi:hypothetical protein
MKLLFCIFSVFLLLHSLGSKYFIYHHIFKHLQSALFLLTFRDMMVSLSPTSKPKKYPLSAVRDWFYSVVAGSSQFWKPSSPSATCWRATPWWQRTSFGRPLSDSAAVFISKRRGSQSANLLMKLFNYSETTSDVRTVWRWSCIVWWNPWRPGLGFSTNVPSQRALRSRSFVAATEVITR